MKKNKLQCTLNKAAEAIGAGIIAGAAGTVAITVSQMIEMQITKRKPSLGPANAVEKTLEIHPEPGTKKRFSQEIHWTYGTLWGIVRGLLSVSGINKYVATGLHYGAVTGVGMAMAPLERAKPVNKWEGRDIAIDLLHHAVYAVVAGAVFEAIYDDKD